MSPHLTFITASILFRRLTFSFSQKSAGIFFQTSKVQSYSACTPAEAQRDKAAGGCSFSLRAGDFRQQEAAQMFWMQSGRSQQHDRLNKVRAGLWGAWPLPISPIISTAKWQRAPASESSMNGSKWSSTAKNEKTAQRPAKMHFMLQWLLLRNEVDMFWCNINEWY